MKTGIKKKAFLQNITRFLVVFSLTVFPAHASNGQGIISLSCKENNDLYLTLKENKIACVRFNTPEEAINHALEGSGVMILAAGYPEETTVMDASLFEKARQKNLRLYIEYPSYLPDMEVGQPRGTHLERAVIASDAFSPSLQKHQILALHDSHWVTDDKTLHKILEWTSTVRPTYTKDEKLPPNARRVAIQRGIDWHTNAKMIINEQGWEEYKKLWKLDESNILTTVPAIDNAAPPPISEVGDGNYGILEGIVSKVNSDGSQPTRWWLRTDSNGESALAFALRWKMDGDHRSRLISENLLNWLYFRAGLFQNNSNKANYGLLFWAPGNAQALYQDNDVKAILGCMGTSGILNTGQWDEVLVKNILGNFRTTGVNGFRGGRLENPDLFRDGWESYWNKNTIRYQPHYEAWMWATYLWLYDKTKWEPLLEKTRKAITLMMEAYPKDWSWTNGFQQERGRMLLPLAWLIRVDDRPEYREWLKRIANDIEKFQDTSGAIQEQLGALEKSNTAPPTSNEDYGTAEAPLIQENGDPVADLLYTCNFTFLGLHEAYAATGDEQYKRMADKLADFLIRVQVRSEKHKTLDGGWFRAFDYQQWEYWGSNAGAGWGLGPLKWDGPRLGFPQCLRCRS
ncbi:MAG: hypothetical protein WD426_08535 [Anditalea sp.]